MADYASLGLSSNLQSISSPANKNNGFVTGYNFDSDYEIQTNRIRCSYLENKSEGGSISLMSGPQRSASMRFSRINSPVEFAEVRIDGGVYTPKIFAIECGTAMDFWIGEDRQWNTFTLNTKNAISLTGGTAQLNIDDNYFLFNNGGTTIAKLYSNGDLHISGTIAENDSTP